VSSLECLAVNVIRTALIFGAITLLAFGIAHANGSKSDRDPLVKATTDFDAANKCALMHFPLMARLGPKYVLCLDSAAGVPQDLRIIEVNSVLARKL
jgi:hypothetical protein